MCRATRLLWCRARLPRGRPPLHLAGDVVVEADVAVAPAPVAVRRALRVRAARLPVLRPLAM